MRGVPTGYRGRVPARSLPAPSVRGLLDALSHPSRRVARRVLLANLVAQIVIVVTGGAVRLTGSGLGCSTWPQCEPGQFTPVRHAATSWHPIIEFGNRTLTGLLVLIAIATAWAVLRQVGRPRSLHLFALVPLVGVLVQAVIGGLAVLVELNPAVVGSHFLISMALVAASTQLVLRFDQPDVAGRWAVAGPLRVLGVALVPLTVLVLVLGSVTTGSGPHSGDEDTPYRFALDPLLITRAHSAAVWLYVAALLATLALVHRSATALPVAWRRTQVLLAVTLGQGVLGYVQYFTGLPGWMVALHMLGASLLVVAQTRHLDGLRERGAGTQSPTSPSAELAAA